MTDIDGDTFRLNYKKLKNTELCCMWLPIAPVDCSYRS